MKSLLLFIRSRSRAQGISKVPYADYIYVLIYTGFRPAELLSMTVDAFDAKERTLTGGIKTEAGKNRVVTLSPKVVPIVERLSEAGSPWIFHRADKEKLTIGYFRDNCFYPALEAMGIQDAPTKDKPPTYVPYSCRHTYANLMKTVTGADVDKAALMGHTDYDMTKYYQSADLASKRLITDAI